MIRVPDLQRANGQSPFGEGSRMYGNWIAWNTVRQPTFVVGSMIAK
jgi:hypothetical protein